MRAGMPRLRPQAVELLKPVGKLILKPGRNDPCPCGSGKKYKKCCADKAAQALLSEPPANISDQLIARLEARQLGDAEQLAQVLLTQYPQSGLVWKVLASALTLQGKPALSAFEEAGRLLPNDLQAQYNLGNEFNVHGRYEEAAASYRRALRIGANCVEAHYNLGHTLMSLGRWQEALTSFRQAVRINPDFAEAYYNMGQVLNQMGQPDEASNSFARALAINPEFAEAYNDLGNVQKDLGQINAAVASFRKALAVRSDYAYAHENLLLAMQYSHDFLPSEIFAEQQEFAERFERPHRPHWPQHPNDKDPHRRLKVGYVSADFRQHPVACFIEPVLA